MEIVNHLEYDIWKYFVDHHPEGNIFHTPEMFEVYSGARGYQPSLWAACEYDRVLALHLPVQITLMGGPLRYLTTRDVDFGGVLVEQSDQGRRGLALLLQEYNRHTPGAPLFTELRNATDQCYIQDVLKNHGYIFEDHLNYLLDLRRDEDIILQSFTKSTRNRIRKVLRRGDVIVEEMTDRTILPVFYKMLLETFNKVRVPLADFTLFEIAFDLLFHKNMAYFSITYADGIPKAALVALIYKDVVYGWYNGVDRSCRKGSNEFAIWDMIKWGVKNGCRVLDFGGAGKPDEKYGVRDFKAKFKGELVNYGRNTRVHAPLRMKVSQKAYQVARRMISNLSRLGTGSPNFSKSN